MDFWAHHQCIQAWTLHGTNFGRYLSKMHIVFRMIALCFQLVMNKQVLASKTVDHIQVLSQSTCHGLINLSHPMPHQHTRIHIHTHQACMLVWSTVSIFFLMSLWVLLLLRNICSVPSPLLSCNRCSTQILRVPIWRSRGTRLDSCFFGRWCTKPCLVP